MYKIFDMRTCGLSHQIKGPVIVNLTILQLKPVLATFTVVGPLIWWDKPQVVMSKFFDINIKTWGPRCVQELATILGPPNRTQERRDVDCRLNITCGMF